jgi:hypothetical protein
MTIHKLPLIILLLALAGASALAADASPERTATDQARAACDALVHGDLEKFVGWTHPKLVHAMGGRERLIETLKTGQRDMARQGIQLLSASIRARVELARGGDDWFAVLPYDLEMTVPEGRALVRTWLLGISPDQGKTWTFVDGGSLTADSVKRLFPNFPATLTFPAKQPPQLEKRKS